MSQLFFVYIASAAEWLAGVEQFLINFDNWQQYVVNVVDANFPVVDVSNLLSNTSGMCIIMYIVYLTHYHIPSDLDAVYNNIRMVWQGSAANFTNLIAVDQCPI